VCRAFAGAFVITRTRRGAGDGSSVAPTTFPQASERTIAVDNLSVAERSERMARIRSKHTKPEMLVRQSLHALGIRYRLHRKDLPGSPDLVFASRKKVVFVHGCFWHAHARCSLSNMPKSRKAYWRAKFDRNKQRDRSNRRLLKRRGWQVLVVWECETKDIVALAGRVASWLAAPRASRAVLGERHGR
jgi:DNA mismatch endonuclease, patch repair protein